MSDKPENPSAFPYQIEGANKQHTVKGMTIRDYFAAAAMQGILAGASVDIDADDLAEQSYCGADAMLKAREDYD